jgi:hypothetical protein
MPPPEDIDGLTPAKLKDLVLKLLEEVAALASWPSQCAECPLNHHHRPLRRDTTLRMITRADSRYVLQFRNRSGGLRGPGRRLVGKATDLVVEHVNAAASASAVQAGERQ